MQPDQLNGTVLIATLKNGKTICADYQRNNCANDDHSCLGTHLCPILQHLGNIPGTWNEGMCNG